MSQPDAGASPNPLTGFTAGNQPNIPGGMRSIYERMTKPQPQDMQVNEKLAHLTRKEIDKVMKHLGQTLEHLAAQREDLTVTRTSDMTSWTVHVEMHPNAPSPVVGQQGTP